MRQSPLSRTRGPWARRTSVVAALAGMVLPVVLFTNAGAAAQKPKIFGIWIGIARNSKNFGKWQNTPNTPAPEFTAWGAEQSREQGRLGVELPTPAVVLTRKSGSPTTAPEESKWVALISPAPLWDEYQAMT